MTDKLMQYGRVERVYIDRSSREHPPVFIHFTSQLSALRVGRQVRIYNDMC